jgi:hypothetical protein
MSTEVPAAAALNGTICFHINTLLHTFTTSEGYTVNLYEAAGTRNLDQVAQQLRGEGRRDLLDWVARRMMVCVVQAVMEAHTRVSGG